jgi:Uncharacterized protein conserved in bacteria (DUF2330)
MRLGPPIVALALCLAAHRAHACGGGLVSSSANVGADAQRIFLSVSGTVTTVVTQVAVPATSADYGVLIPVPAKPLLDPNPVPSAAFDELDAFTAPRIVHDEPTSDDFSLGCGSNSKSTSAGGSVTASAPVQIGPVTAVTLTADDGTALNEWLAANGFAVPDEGRALVDAYAGPGRFFIALKRSTSAADGAPSSVGVRFTLPGDQRTLPLKFARLGAAETVAFTVFVAIEGLAGPEPPFEAVTLDKLDKMVVSRDGYRAAVARAVADRHGRAFVVESVRAISGLPHGNALLAGLSSPQTGVTRLSTIVKREDLTADASLAGMAPVPLPDTIRLPTPAAVGALAVPALVLVILGRSRRHRSRRVDSVS